VFSKPKQNAIAQRVGGDRTKIFLCQPKRSDRSMTTLGKWSVEDYHRMIAAGSLRDRRVELLAGDIVHMSPEEPGQVLILSPVAQG
jgi:hypothetical protein